MFHFKQTPAPNSEVILSQVFPRNYHGKIVVIIAVMMIVIMDNSVNNGKL